jgi:hypothetical protein
VRHHHEEVHNVYLSMPLNAGWMGGIIYIMTVLITLLFGLRQVFRRTPFQSLLIVAWSCFLAIVIEGFIIDTDHWRHFFVLMAMVWGLSEAARVPQVMNAGHLPRRMRRMLATRSPVRMPLPLAATPARRSTTQFMAVAKRPCALHSAPLRRTRPPLTFTTMTGRQRLN